MASNISPTGIGTASSPQNINIEVPVSQRENNSLLSNGRGISAGHQGLGAGVARVSSAASPLFGLAVQKRGRVAEGAFPYPKRARIEILPSPAAGAASESQPMDLDPDHSQLPAAEDPDVEMGSADLDNSRIIRSQHDRFIRGREIFEAPGARSFGTVLTNTPPKSKEDYLHRKALETALFGKQLDLPNCSVLRPPVPLSTDFRPLVNEISPKEIEAYERKTYFYSEVKGFEDDFYSHPISYCEAKDKIAYIERVVEGSTLKGFKIYTRPLSMLRNFGVSPLYPPVERPVSILLTPGGGKMIVGKLNGTVECAAGGRKWEINPAVLTGKEPCKIISLAIAKGKIYVGDDLGSLYQIDPKTQAARRIITFRRFGQERICNIVTSPNGNYLAVGTDKGRVSIFNTNEVKKIGEVFPSRKQSSIRAIAFAPDGSDIIAVGGGTLDPRVHIYPFLISQEEFREKVIRINNRTQTTNILWPEKDRIITTHGDGSYCIHPLSLENRALGRSSITVNTRDGRALFSAIRKRRDGHRALLMSSPNQYLVANGYPESPPEAPSKNYPPSLIK